MSTLLIVELIALVLGVGYLYFKHWQRIRDWAPTEDYSKWTGHGIEASAIKPRVDQVRRDYLAARQGTKGVCFHRYLIRFARRAIIQLGYFRRGEPEDHAHSNGSALCP